MDFHTVTQGVLSPTIPQSRKASSTTTINKIHSNCLVLHGPGRAHPKRGQLELAPHFQVLRVSWPLQNKMRTEAFEKWWFAIAAAVLRWGGHLVAEAAAHHLCCFWWLLMTFENYPSPPFLSFSSLLPFWQKAPASALASWGSLGRSRITFGAQNL